MDEAEQRAWIELLENSEFGPYRPEKYIASGGFSVVFEAKDVRTGNLVALKVLQPGATPDQVFEFSRERSLLDNLSRSSNVVHILDSSTSDIQMTSSSGFRVPLRISYHALELAHGCLEELLVARDQVKVEERLRLWRGIILGVHQMHLKGIAHRDVKSSNCLLFIESRSRTASKISDLGRSRRFADPAHHQLFEYKVGRGDYRFAPPEFLFWQGRDTAQSHKCADIYGLGSLLCEVMTGEGITGLAFGYGPDVVERSIKYARNDQQIDLSGLRNRYVAAYRLFEDSTPKQIRQLALALLKQLCDPVPEKRLPALGIGRKPPANDELVWLLRRADILIKSLARPQNPRSSAGRNK
jgi:serine/threonine protein kinase